MIKGLLVGLMAAFCATAVPARAQALTPPDALARSVTDEVLAVLRAD